MPSATWFPPFSRLWGDQYLIGAVLLADVASILGMAYATFHDSPAVAVASAAVALASSGNLTNRWTVVFPMLGWGALQALRHLVLEAPWALTTIRVLSALLVFLATMFSILFPPTELPFPSKTAVYKVGVADVYLPLDLEAVKKWRADAPADSEFVGDMKVGDDALVRIWYPIAPMNAKHSTESSSSIPYLRPRGVVEFCEEIMRMGAPTEVAKNFAFFFHTLRLARTQASENASLLSASSKSKFPVIVYSHGLGGNSCIYSYQTQAMAANGYVVISLEHTDGSAPMVPKKDGTLLRMNKDVVESWKEKKFVEYAQRRRAQSEYRTDEFIGALEAFLSLNDKNIPGMEEVGLDFTGRLDTEKVVYMGHSFGGATALNAAHIRKPTAVIAHEPATAWMPDSARRTLFDPERLLGSPFEYTGDTGGFPEDLVVPESRFRPFDDMDSIILFSEEWKTKQWSGAHVLEDMHARGVLGRKNRVHVLEKSVHSEFSDLCMLLPLWIARSIGFAGPRNPVEMAEEIHRRSLDFLESIKEK